MRRISKLLLTVVVAFGFILAIDTTSHALNKPTHKFINEYISENTLNGFSLDSYLKDQLGFQAGKDSSFNGETAEEWIRDGGAHEDEPAYIRSANHFHNPLTKQGFTGLSWFLWGFFGLFDGQSSIQWSQNDPNTQSPGGHYSWFDVRDYYYNGLTSIDKATRDQNFEDMFKGIGQLMHLVEDLSVPEHTKNTLHGLPLTYIYEDWVGDNIKSIGDLSNFLNPPERAPKYFDQSKIGLPPALADLGPVPITNLFDTNQYVDPNPNPNVTLRTDIGLSEYTNANFLCPGTMFTPDFPYPNWDSLVQNPDPDPVTGKWYLTKLGQNDPPGPEGQIGNGERINHFAVSRWGDKLLPPSISQSGISLKMDKQVYADYAAHLIPRAVGYAADLLKYFFRGKIAVLNSQWTATDVTFKIRNDTLNESMGPGTLVVCYEDDSGYGGVSNEIQMNETIAAGTASLNEYTVTFPEPISDNDNPKYWFVFRGKLGNEDKAVVAKAEKGSDLASSIGCVSDSCELPPGEVCPGCLFYVPPLAEGGGSFTVKARDIFDATAYFMVDCSYGSGNMSCDLTLYYQHPDWNGGIPVFCALDHCEGPWDGYSFYGVCDLVQQGQGVCYQLCDPNHDNLIWVWLFTQ